MTVEIGADIPPDPSLRREVEAALAWAPPAGSEGAWLELQRQTVAIVGGPPCARDPEAWWAGRSQADAPRVAAAVQGCRWCPAREACAAYALAAGEPAGIWGGLTVDDRAALVDRGAAS